MSYTRFVKLMDEDADMPREKIMKKLKCGEMQVAAYRSRFKAEVEGKKRAAKQSRPPSPAFKPIKKTAAPRAKRGKKAANAR